MKIIECFHNTGSVKPRSAVVEMSFVPKHCPQFAAQAGLHQHIKVFSILEGLKQLDDKVAISFAHYSLLGHDMLLLSRLDDLGFLHLLQREGSRAVTGYLD